MNDSLAEIAIRFDHVNLSVPTKNGVKHILRDIQVSAPKGKIITIVGPSGSGKSTLLSLCNLLRTPSSGAVYVFDKEVRAWNIPELRRRVGLVFQTPTIFPGSVADNLSVGHQLRGVKLEHPEVYLESVGLPRDLLTQPADTLSGGQKQRLALARVLCNEPDILLLDEVTSALDIGAAKEVEETILSIHQARKTTILWVTHQLEQARRVGDETWLFIDGRLIEAAPTASFFENPKEDLTRSFLSGELNRGDLS
jgi:putative ABC transport system ATP-binding protein